MQNIPRWYFDSLPPEGRGEIFRTNKRLRDKVDDEGKFRFFCGETTVFDLPDNVREKLMEVQARLYDAAEDMFSVQRLSEESMHMTLHSFWDMAEDIKYADVPYTEEEVCSVLDSVRSNFPDRIMMRAVVPLSMVNTSVVMGLMPASEPDAWRLGEIHRRMSALYPRPYCLTPHVTLAYYRPGEYPEELWKKLKSVFTVEGFAFPIKTEQLFFRRFYDMERYETVY